MFQPKLAVTAMVTAGAVTLAGVPAAIAQDAGETITTAGTDVVETPAEETPADEEDTATGNNGSSSFASFLGLNTDDPMMGVQIATAVFTFIAQALAFAQPYIDQFIAQRRAAAA